MKNQEQFVIRQLRETGQISRNFCLDNYISRLGAIICDLKKEGYEFESGFVKTPNGKDYVYKMTKSPFTRVDYRVDGHIVGTKWLILGK
jgi:hypothetical protein